MRRGFTLRELLVVIAIIAVVFALFSNLMLWIPFTLAFGWVSYLWRVVPQAKPDPWTVGTAVACLVGVTVGSHFFLRWLAGAEWPWKRTFRCVGLVVLVFVAGIAMVGMTHQTAWLIRSPEPLIGGFRGPAARMASANNLKQIGIAAGYSDEARKELPRSSFNAAGQPLHSWQTALLPFVEQDAIYKQIDQMKPWTHPVNALPMSHHIKTFLNPAIAEDRVNGFGGSHYAGNVFVVMGDAKQFDSFPAGTSNTILAGEVSSNFRAWGDPLNARDPRLGGTGQPNSFGGPNGKPAQFVMLDGSVRTFDPKELAELVGKVPE